MCFSLFIASPLTLSEVRSMIPAGLSADLADLTTHRLFRKPWPDLQTVARLLHGACSCDLVVQRHAVSREDEAWLRGRYRALGLSRDQVLRALDNHRAALERRPVAPGHWPGAVAEFVAEHARNAGASVYLLHFAHDGFLPALSTTPVIERTAAEVRAAPGAWLPEEQAVRVMP
jgi:hypothetical protein